MRLCDFPGCGHKHLARGLCGTHYSQWARGVKLRKPRRPLPPSCVVAGCGRKAVARGLCMTHWAQVRRSERLVFRGDRLASLMSVAPASIRIGWHTGPREPNGCRLWLGHRDGRGYGKVGINGRHQNATRVILGLGPGDPRLACHHCDNPPCVEPSHLYAGTMTDNVRDMIVRGRSRSVGLRGEENPQASLTAAQVVEIRRRSEAGEDRTSLSLEFRTTHHNIAHIRAGESWAWLTEDS